jgi:transcriptional regulator with XRE-family HTH domain
MTQDASSDASTDAQGRVLRAIEAAMAERGMTQRELGAAIGMAQPNVHRMLSGRHVISVDRLVEVAAAIGQVDQDVVVEALIGSLFSRAGSARRAGRRAGRPV